MRCLCKGKSNDLLQAIVRMVYTKLVVCEVMNGAIDSNFMYISIGTVMREILAKEDCFHLWPFRPDSHKSDSSKQRDSPDRDLEQQLSALYSHVVAMARFYANEEAERTSVVALMVKDHWEAIKQKAVNAALSLLRRATFLMKAVRSLPNVNTPSFIINTHLQSWRDV